MVGNLIYGFILSVVFSLTLVHSTDPLYTISAPNNFRFNTPYQLLVTNHQAPGPIDLVVELKADDSNETQPLVREAKVEVGETKLVELPIGSWGPGTYTLTINGTGGIEFSKTSRLNYNAKTFSAFIQTDKAVYKPGQIVHFRIITTDVGLKPVDLNESTIYIMDSQGNRVKQWSNVTFGKGVFEGSLQLSDQVILGDWHIRASLKKNQFVKYFSVDEYVLPTYEVIVKPPSYAIYNDSNIVITVEAKYTYGKPVKGKVLVNVTDFYCKWPCTPYNMKPFTTTTSIDGTADVQVNLVRDLALPDWMRHDRRFEVFAVVTEELTGRQQNGSGDVTMYESKYKLAFSDSGNFKPGLKYTITLTVSLQDGSPILEDGEISVNYFSDWNSPAKTLNYTIPQNGEIDVEIIPPESTDNLRFETSYKGARTTAYVSKAQSLSERYLQISVDTLKSKIGDEVAVIVHSTKELNDNLIVQVIGRGNILHQESVAPSKTKTQTLKLKMTPEMAPKVRVIVYYATSCGEVVADAIDFSVEGIFKTKVDIQANPNSTKPGSPVDVQVTTEPHAYVGLLAVDQSVLLLKSGNDITTKEVLDDLQLYEIGRQSYYSYRGGDYMIRPWRPPAPSTIQLFSSVGLIFFTNGLFAHIPSYGGYGGGGMYLQGNRRYKNRLAMPRPAVQFAPQAMASGAPRPPPPPPNRGSSMNDLMEPTRVRRHFPETFLWTNATADDNGVVSIKTNAPDTITSFVITAFAVHEENGLGLSSSPAKLQVFRSFFVALNLPYSIVRGEAVALQALVFNYLKEDVDAEITLENEQNALEFVELENTVDDDKSSQKKFTKTIRAKAGEGTSVTFLVSSKKLDYVDIKVVARSTVAADAIVKKLLVKAEGKTVYFNKAFLVDLRNQSSFEEKIALEIPKDAVSESEKIEVSAISDVMGSTINNMDQLLRMPYGCGEQNMLNFVPNIVITEYLTKTKQLNDEVKNKALKFMESGYQRELTYKRRDGSFSAFGNNDKNGSVWLTAFVVKSFVQAKNYITISDDVVATSLNWLKNNQAANGSFSEVGEVFHKAMQGGSGKGLSLTAYVLSAFLESQKNDNKTEVDDAVKKALTYLENELPNLKSDYDLVITTYVLHLAGSSKKDEAFEKMNLRARTERDIKFWSLPLPAVNDSVPYYSRPQSVDVEMTAYALLTYVQRGLVPEAIPIMRWLISKRNSNGGFESTQDTVMGIQALAKFAASLTPPEGSKLDITVSYESDKKDFAITKETALILHREQLPRTTRDVTISATGNGVGVVQVSWSYNVLTTDKRPAFTIHTNATGENEELNVVACTKYSYEVNGESNMAVLEIDFPSGYVADLENLPAIDDKKKIKKIETKNGDTQVVVYFDKIGEEVCTSARGHRSIKVANIKPALVQVYDYYDPMKRAEQFYNAPATSVCDLCETEACKKKEKCA